MWNRILHSLCLHALCLLAGSLAFSSLASAADPKAGQKIGLDARLAQPVMKGGEAQKNYLRVALQGCTPEPNQSRTPVNVAFVIDRSGSMPGERIVQAQGGRHHGRQPPRSRDIASVVIFDNVTDVLMQAQPVAQPRPVRQRHPADRRARLDRHPRRRAGGRQRGAPLQGARSASIA